MKNSLQHVVGIALRLPVVYQPLVAEQRIVGAEHDEVLEPARNLVTQIGGVIFWRPAVQLVPDVTLMHENGDRFRLPRPSRPRSDDLEVRIGRSDPVEMARMTVVENDAGAAG